MSAAFDAALTRREPELPGLGVLLDPDEFARRLARALPDAGIGPATPTYVRYKPRTSCLAAFRIDSPAGDVAVYARAHRPAVPEKLRSAGQAAEESSALGPGGAVLADLAVAVHAFPHDRRLPALTRLTDDRARRGLLRRALPDHRSLWDGRPRTLRYKPERRWVAVLECAGGERALLKLHAELRPATAAVPRLGELAEHGLVVHPWVDGRPLDEALAAQDPGAPEAAREAGAALAALHLGDGPLDPALLTHPAPSGLGARLSAAADAVAWLCPPLTHPAVTLAATLGHEDAAATAPACPVHGDWSADQVVLGPHGASIIDLDGAHRGDPSRDVASFIADLEAKVLSGRVAARAAAATAHAMLAGYRAAGGPAITECDALARAVAGELLLRSPEPFRLRHRRWGSHTAALLLRAEDLASRGGEW